MELTTKAVFLIFLCAFATLAVPFAVRFASGLSLKRPCALTVLTPTADPQGDPIGTPGGGGSPTVIN